MNRGERGRDGGIIPAVLEYGIRTSTVLDCL